MSVTIQFVRLRRSVFRLVLVLCVAGGCAGCGDSQAKPETTEQVAGATHTLLDPACEQNASDGVHNPVRLQVLKPCAVFQGTVVQAPKLNPSDGDVAFVASPDPAYAAMLNAKNRLKGGLHIEIVPRDQPGCTPGQPVVVGNVPGLGICSGRDIAGPVLGAHIRIVGPWVLDRNDDWNEIHPAWSIGAPGCRVPRVIGRKLRQARSAIAAGGCLVGRVSHRFSRKRLKGHVLNQRPRAGSLVLQNARVDLIVGRGRRR